ncbi:TPA_exp: Uncharacterized protein A8136_6138 [Trichophyton benhamiae CBS 112371]|nr:TPA_exp: Uncharacterized protein A8136_6138 [Trichophyton benhamiae CBS 112371]
MRPMAGPLISVRAKYYERKLLKILIPLWKTDFQYRHVKESQRDGQWLIEISENYGSEQLTAKRVAGHILALISIPSSDEIVGTLIAKCQNVSAQYRGMSSKEAIDKLYCLEPAVRESMRLNDVMVHLVTLDIISGQPINIGEGIQISAESGLRTVFFRPDGSP